MTLETQVYLLDECDPRTVFWLCNMLIGAPKDVKWRVTDTSIHNEPDQGLCAWLFVYHGGDDWYVKQAGHEDDCEPDCHYHHAPKCWAAVSFDTAYSYRSLAGRGCGDLHAGLVRSLGTWLDANHIRWCWRNEFTGELHSRYEGLEQLGPGGLEASNWFENTVKPVIEAESQRRGQHLEWADDE